jgi:outer membrane receptor protein involved in Fe transport
MAEPTLTLKHLTLISAISSLLFTVVFVLSAQAADATRRTFAIEAGDAVRSLETFSEQAGTQIVFLVDDVRGVTTNAVRGEMTPREALDRMLADTPLAVAQDEQNGALAVRRSPNAGAPRPSPSTPRSGNSAPGNETSNDVVRLSSYVVTGRAGTEFRTKAETSYALTDVSAEQLRLQAPIGVAEALKAVPGFWVEASGGEASNNIRARGIPADGFSTVSLQEDGLPVQHDGGLGWLNADQSYRLDETVERLEVVRGGPSSVFASNAPGGIVNFVTRLGGETPGGVVKYEIGDFNHHRVEGWFGGPAGEWRYGVGGFWRVSDGIRDPGFRGNDGYQVRVSLGRDLPNGGRIDTNIKHFDDHVIFYLPIPLTFDGDGDPAGLPGFNPNFGTVVGPETQRVDVRTPSGSQVIDVESGTHVKLTQFTAKLELPLPGEWKLENGFRYRTSETKRENFFPNNLTPGTTRLDQLRAGALAAFPTATDVQFRYVTTPGAVFDPVGQNGTGLVLDGTAIRIGVDLDEVINDLRLMKNFSFGEQTHDVAFGFYLAWLDEKFRDLRATLFTDVRNNARLLDLVAVDASGAAVGTVTDRGVFRHGSNFANGEGDSLTTAFYFSDEWQITEQLRVDAGVRWEQIETDGRTERFAGVNLGTPSTSNVLSGTGVYDPYDRRFSRAGWTVGADWQFTPSNGLFARFTPTFRLPSVGSFITNPTATPVIQRTDLYEVGYKYVSQPFSVYLTAFRTTFDNFSFTDTVFDPATGGFTQRTVFIKTETDGIELEGSVRPAPWFDLSATATFQKPEFGDFRITQNVNGAPVAFDFTGNQLLRVPEISFRIVPGFNLVGNRLRVQFPVEYYSDRFADAANSVTLPSYAVFNAAVRFDVTDRVTLHVNVDNIDNSIGLTEGNPRAGQFQSGDAGARYYLARPILGRSYRAAITYRF